jgi:hypothetical protein
MSTAPRRSARLAEKAVQPAVTPVTEPVPVRKAAKATAKTRAMTREEHLVATDPKWAADKALREGYQAGSWATAPTPRLLAMHEVVEGVAALKAKIKAAKTVEEFEACAAIADRELYEKAEAFEWADPMAMFFLTDTRSHATEAVAWLKWAAANPAQAMAFVRALQREKAGDYSGESSYKLSPANLCSSSPIEAKKWAIGALTSFEKSMF